LAGASKGRAPRLFLRTRNPKERVKRANNTGQVVNEAVSPPNPATTVPGARTLNRCQTKQSRNRTRNDSIQDFLPAIKSKDEGTEKPDNSFARKHSARGCWRFARTKLMPPTLASNTMSQRRASDRKRVPRETLERAVTAAVKKSDPQCEAFVGVLIEHHAPRARIRTGLFTEFGLEQPLAASAAKPWSPSSIKSQGFEFQKDQDGER
jgi:hypothetical protein